jgi:hypothetical protein
MSKIKEIFGSGHIQVALATGISIIVMAYMSKRVMEEPISDLFLAVPPPIITTYEAVLQKKKKAGGSRGTSEGPDGPTAPADAKAASTNTAFWVAAIFAATLAVILNGMR